MDCHSYNTICEKETAVWSPSLNLCNDGSPRWFGKLCRKLTLPFLLNYTLIRYINFSPKWNRKMKSHTILYNENHSVDKKRKTVPSDIREWEDGAFRGEQREHIHRPWRQGKARGVHCKTSSQWELERPIQRWRSIAVSSLGRFSGFGNESSGVHAKI